MFAGKPTYLCSLVYPALPLTVPFHLRSHHVRIILVLHFVGPSPKVLKNRDNPLADRRNDEADRRGQPEPALWPHPLPPAFIDPPTRHHRNRYLGPQGTGGLPLCHLSS